MRALIAHHSRFRATCQTAVAATLVAWCALPATAHGAAVSYHIAAATIDTEWHTSSTFSTCTTTVTAEQHDTLAPGSLGVHINEQFVDVRPSFKGTVRAAVRDVCAGGESPPRECSADAPHD